MVRVRTEAQILFVVLFLATVAILSYTPSITGMATIEADNSTRYVVVVKETQGVGNLITGNIVGSSKDAKDEILNDVNDEGILSIFIEDDVKEEYELDELPVMVVKANKEGAQKLASHPLVEEVIVDFALDLYLDDTAPLVNAELVNQMQTSGVKLNGTGVSVCYVDTGIQDDHPAFAGRIVREKCYCAGCCGGGSSESNNAEDQHPQTHGTHVAGIIGSNGQYKGMAPGVGLVAVKVCSSSCMLGDVLAGMNFCAAKKDEYNIKVMSASLGDNGKYQTQEACPTYLDSAINAAYNKGIVTTIASGNNGYTNGISYPSCSPHAVAVGATTKNDNVASYSNRGSLMELYAPGSSITSTIKPSTYGSLSGTSMSTPHVAGAAAILAQYAELANLSQGPDDILAALQNSSVIIGGYPRLDLLSSLLSLGWTNATPQPPAPSAPWNFTILSPVGFRVTTEDVLFAINITGNYSNTTNFEITWSSNLSKKDWIGNNVTQDLKIGNQTITVNVTGGNHSIGRTFRLRAVPIVNCSIDIDMNGDGIVDVGDIVILSQQTNISCVAPMAMPNCLVDIATTNVTKKEIEKYLEKVVERDLKDVYREDCLMEIEEF